MLSQILGGLSLSKGFPKKSENVNVDRTNSRSRCFVDWRSFVGEFGEPASDRKIVIAATDGLRSVQSAEKLQPDVILMDIPMPGLNGIEAAKKIRAFSPRSKIVFLS